MVFLLLQVHISLNTEKQSQGSINVSAEEKKIDIYIYIYMSDNHLIHLQNVETNTVSAVMESELIFSSYVCKPVARLRLFDIAKKCSNFSLHSTSCKFPLFLL